MNRVCIYVRCTPQGRHPHREIELLKQVVEAKGWIMGGLFVDRDGTYLRDILQTAGDGEFQIVLVWSLDRLTGSPYTFFRLNRRLKKAKVRLVAVDPPFGFIRPKHSLSDEPAVQQLIEDFEDEREWVFDHGLAERPSKALR